MGRGKTHLWLKLHGMNQTAHHSNCFRTWVDHYRGQEKHTSSTDVLHNEDIFDTFKSSLKLWLFLVTIQGQDIGFKGWQEIKQDFSLDFTAGGLQHHWDRHCKRGWGHSRDRLLKGPSLTFFLPSGRSSTRSEDECWCKQTGVQGGILWEVAGHAADQLLLQGEAPLLNSCLRAGACKPNEGPIKPC